jgi:hypothetical protein
MDASEISCFVLSRVLERNVLWFRWVKRWILDVHFGVACLELEQCDVNLHAYIKLNHRHHCLQGFDLVVMHSYRLVNLGYDLCVAGNIRWES